VMMRQPCKHSGDPECSDYCQETMRSLDDLDLYSTPQVHKRDDNWLKRSIETCRNDLIQIRCSLLIDL
jgi:hypothetical protein